jgi:hypothetical protein
MRSSPLREMTVPGGIDSSPPRRVDVIEGDHRPIHGVEILGSATAHDEFPVRCSACRCRPSPIG